MERMATTQTALAHTSFRSEMYALLSCHEPPSLPPPSPRLSHRVIVSARNADSWLQILTFQSQDNGGHQQQRRQHSKDDGCSLVRMDFSCCWCCLFVCQRDQQHVKAPPPPTSVKTEQRAGTYRHLRLLLVQHITQDESTTQHRTLVYCLPCNADKI